MDSNYELKFNPDTVTVIAEGLQPSRLTFKLAIVQNLEEWAAIEETSEAVDRFRALSQVEISAMLPHQHLRQAHEQALTDSWNAVVSGLTREHPARFAVAYAAALAQEKILALREEIQRAERRAEQIENERRLDREAVREFYPAAVAYADEQGACGEFETATQPLYDRWPDIVEEHDRTVTVTVEASTETEIPLRAYRNGQAEEYLYLDIGEFTVDSVVHPY